MTFPDWKRDIVGKNRRAFLLANNVRPDKSTRALSTIPVFITFKVHGLLHYWRRSIEGLNVRRGVCASLYRRLAISAIVCRNSEWDIMRILSGALGARHYGNVFTGSNASGFNGAAKCYVENHRLSLLLKRRHDFSTVISRLA